MKYLGLALYAEGPTDYRFLPGVIRRTTENLCLRGTDELVELSDVISLHAPAVQGEDHRDGRTKVVDAAREAWEAFDLLFLHSIAAGDYRAALAERIEPARALMQAQAGGDARRLIGVVPVREMEAWTLADGDTLRSVFGTNLTNAELGIPARPVQVEGVLDPKQVLEDAYQAVVRGRKPRGQTGLFLTLIGETIRLDCLRRVPSFRRFEQELQTALLELNIIKTTVY